MFDEWESFKSYSMISLAPPPEHCFSIVSDVKTLDISVRSIRERVRSVFALKLLLSGVFRCIEEKSTENPTPVPSESVRPEGVPVQMKSNRSFEEHLLSDTKIPESSNHTDNPETITSLTNVFCLSNPSSDGFERFSEQHKIPPLQMASLRKEHDFACPSIMHNPGNIQVPTQSSRFQTSNFADNCSQKDLQGLMPVSSPSVSHLNLDVSNPHTGEPNRVSDSPKQSFESSSSINPSFVSSEKSDLQNMFNPVTNQHTGNQEPLRSELDLSYLMSEKHLVTDMFNCPASL